MINWDVNNEEIGTVDFTKGNILVSDPCYKGEYGVSLDVKQTHYDVSVLKEDGYNSAIMAIAKGEYISNLDWEKYEDEEIAVDSGQAGFFEWDSFYTEEVIDKNAQLPFSKDEDEENNFYPFVSSLTLNSDESAGCYSKGCVSSTGYGDGSYNLYLAKKNNVIVGLLICFIEDERVECYHCGNLFNEDELSEGGYCYNCEEYEEVPCAECGSHYYKYELNEDDICDDCLEEEEGEEY